MRKFVKVTVTSRMTQKNEQKNNKNEQNEQRNETDYEHLIPELLKAATRGSAKAQYYLGVLYSDGLGVSQDYGQAAEWYRKAVEQGHAKAQLYLGLLYQSGRGVEQDYEQAAELYTDAARQGEKKAQYYLDQLHELDTARADSVPVPTEKLDQKFSAQAPDFRHGDKPSICYNKKTVGASTIGGDEVRPGNPAFVVDTRIPRLQSWGVCQRRSKSNYIDRVILTFLALLTVLVVPGVGVYAYRVLVVQPGSQYDMTYKEYSEERIPKERTRTVSEQADELSRMTLANSQYDTAEKYQNGNGVERDYTQANYWYQKAAENGHKEAQYLMGNRYECGYQFAGVNRDYEQALRWYNLAAEQDHAEAQYKLGNLYSGGYGVRKDYAKAKEWYLKAAKNGSQRAFSPLAYLYLAGSNNSDGDMEEALYWYRKAADLGDVDAQNLLGNLMAGRNDKEAAHWWRKAAEKGNTNSQCRLGRAYYEGKGIEKNNKLAVYWYRRAAEQGDREAQNVMGNFYRDGEGVECSYGQAIEWYKKSAEQGYVYAQVSLGNIYRDGYGVKRDDRQATEWYRKAARQGNGYAQSALKKAGLIW